MGRPFIGSNGFAPPTASATMMSRGLGPHPHPPAKPEGRTSLSTTALAEYFARAARHLNHKNVPLKPIARRGGASSQGELSEFRAPSVAHAEALALARFGPLQLSRQSSSRAMDLALQERQREGAASYQAARAVWEAVCGNAAEGKRNATAALAMSNGRDVEYAAGLALALSGDSSRSQPLADDLEKRFPEDTFAKFTYVPVLRALSALNRGKPADSVERLHIALPMSWR